MNELVAQTQEYRNSLISYVYKIIGSQEEAKDIVQETIIRFISKKHDEIENTKAWLFKVATNLALDFLRSAKSKREVYIGTWLPEPYIEEKAHQNNEMELDESLSMALLVLMEKLSIKERIAYILHDLFEFKHKEIADILQTSTQNSRQLNSRANKKLQTKKKKYTPTKEEHIKLTNSFLKALKEGDFEELRNMFKEEVSLYSDGGGKAIAARKVLYGDNDYISKFLVKVTKHLFEASNKNDVEISTIWFNGSLGVILKENGKVITSYSFEIKDNMILNIFALRNPDKLKYFDSIK
ncbi:RNA polymerase sigma factor SigJ [Arcobacter roscoffensis]|uniref:RNA polymerase sigma factor SigJ n=1 Tax=Arcobacter roscoffensis TaxID=2961520 RepID=A0ABY5E3M3_9BACT|nr:RNA polymerase sigma factor SigJ [Arcobacter roscoffensis]UTJ05336.1 RNA polymerase sigma factor SigJ [Arcobacter roscoffensis]